MRLRFTYTFNSMKAYRDSFEPHLDTQFHEGLSLINLIVFFLHTKKKHQKKVQNLKKYRDFSEPYLGTQSHEGV